jgi:hypothetical protein
LRFFASFRHPFGGGARAIHPSLPSHHTAIYAVHRNPDARQWLLAHNALHRHQPTQGKIMKNFSNKTYAVIVSIVAATGVVALKSEPEQVIRLDTVVVTAKRLPVEAQVMRLDTVVVTASREQVAAAKRDAEQVAQAKSQDIAI